MRLRHLHLQASTNSLGLDNLDLEIWITLDLDNLKLAALSDLLSVIKLSVANQASITRLSVTKRY
jgi:hypothetical protein